MTPTKRCTGCCSWPSARAARASACSDGSACRLLGSRGFPEPQAARATDATASRKLRRAPQRVRSRSPPSLVLPSPPPFPPSPHGPLWQVPTLSKRLSRRMGGPAVLALGSQRSSEAGAVSAAEGGDTEARPFWERWGPRLTQPPLPMLHRASLRVPLTQSL